MEEVALENVLDQKEYDSQIRIYNKLLVDDLRNEILKRYKIMTPIKFNQSSTIYNWGWDGRNHNECSLCNIRLYPDCVLYKANQIGFIPICDGCGNSISKKKTIKDYSKVWRDSRGGNLWDGGKTRI